jgi:hypothetical protein
MYRIRTGSKFDFERGKQTSHQIQIEDPFATYLFMFGESKLAVWLWLSLHMEKGGAVTLDLDQAIAGPVSTAIDLWSKQDTTRKPTPRSFCTPPPSR